MNNEHADELINKFLLSGSLKENAYDGVEIQELILLFHHAHHLLKTKPGESVWLEPRMKELLFWLKEKIKTAEVLYIAYDSNTNYPYVDAEGRVWFFSKKEYAAYAEDYFLQQFVMLKMKEISGEEIMNTIGLLHLLGLPVIVVDNGQYYIEVMRDELLPPMDWSGTPENQIPVTNPGLAHAMILFFQTMKDRLNTPNKEKLLQTLEECMLDEIIHAKYLLPMQLLTEDTPSPDDQGNITLNQGDRIQFGFLEGEEDSKWLPAFTDWVEFEKVFDKNLWSSYVATYEDLLTISKSMTGIVLNPHGLGLRLDAKNKANIEKYRIERIEASPSTDTSIAVPEAEAEDEANVLLGEPKEFPTQLQEAILAHMKNQRNIKKAYLRQKLLENKQSYVLIVDIEGEKEEIFRGISNVTAPHLIDVTLDIIEMNDWIEEVKDIKPFYKKKRFGLF